jgi:hypothetical protein
MKLICNGIEKETKYSGGWLDSYGRQWIYEDMETSHLLNVYHHIKNNLQLYLNLDILSYEDIEIRKANIDHTRNEMKQELLLRGLSDSEIENHIEETWKMGPNPYIVEV